MDREVSAQTPAGRTAFKAAAEEAIQAAGLHLAEGGRVWEAYRCGALPSGCVWCRCCGSCCCRS